MELGGLQYYYSGFPGVWSRSVGAAPAFPSFPASRLRAHRPLLLSVALQLHTRSPVSTIPLPAKKRASSAVTPERRSPPPSVLPFLVPGGWKKARRQSSHDVTPNSTPASKCSAPIERPGPTEDRRYFM
ncbi:hypothetical protein BOTBODRAFT_272714 [Botryobasidium botryosum FD-172 SS1]|uniref:Uncharacterized protein n=1 Tax=Botryobasidium botryosum (strain FD-172 SS1) TaxID=930990 RepID=A0A067MM40_BOTB1|nr:hypothetical protein BOTBODRAFT_272714 [Botryobasidium botryosum FD-172 SS1]